MAYKLALLTGDGGQHPLAVKFLPAYLDQFALGMGLAVFTVWLAARTGPAPLLVRVVDRAPGLAWLVAFAAYLSLAHIGLPLSGGPGHSTGVFLLRHAIFGGVGLAVLLPAVIGDPSHGFVRRLLANPVLLYLGLVSYAIYLWHPTVILLFVRHGVIGGGPQLLWPLGVLAVTVAAATFSYYAVERPALRLRPARGVPAPVPQEAAVEAPAPAG
jgi:peptidoglycan/LPS O-acetylase OafA/YrhL